MRYLTGFVVVLVAIFALGFLIPVHRDFQVDNSALIAEKPAAIFPYLNNFHRFGEWASWASRTKKTEVVFSGPDEGLGAKISWKSRNDRIGKGRMEIVESKPDETVVIDLAVRSRQKARMTYRLTPSGSGTTVNWSVDGSVDSNLFSYLTGRMLDESRMQDYGGRLESLKSKVEAGPS